MLSIKTKEKLINPKYHLWTAISEMIYDNSNTEMLLGRIEEKTENDPTDNIILFLKFKYAPNKTFESFYAIDYIKTEENFFKELKKTRNNISIDEYATLYEKILNEKERKYIAKKTYETIDKTLELFDIK